MILRKVSIRHIVRAAALLVLVHASTAGSALMTKVACTIGWPYQGGVDTTSCTNDRLYCGKWNYSQCKNVCDDACTASIDHSICLHYCEVNNT